MNRTLQNRLKAWVAKHPEANERAIKHQAERIHIALQQEASERPRAAEERQSQRGR